MTSKILLTSFKTWLPHQKSNSSDDLLGSINIVREQQSNLDSLLFLRQLPVSIQLASQQVINAIDLTNPKGIVCCGMAEFRNKLSLESNAVCQEDCAFTEVDLAELIIHLNNTDISHNAGKFVCEGLYYQILKYIQVKCLSIPCIFVHVPIIQPDNLNAIQQDFLAIIRFMQSI